MRRCAVVVCVIAALTLSVSQPVAAQDNAAEVSIGYSFLSNDDLAVNATNLPLGLFLGFAFPMNDRISIATDISGHYRRGIPASDSTALVVAAIPTNDFQQLSFNLPETGWCSPVLGADFCEVHIQTVAAVGGPRFHFGNGFAHVLAGGTRSLRKIGFFAHTSTNLTIQLGGGADVDMTENTAFRFQVDWRRVFYGEPDQMNPGASLVSTGGADYQDLTFSLGLVWRVGQR